MTIESLDLLPLRPVRVRSNGRRDFDPEDKRRLVQMCLESAISVSGMALKAGVNANQLRKWIDRYQPSSAGADSALTPFVPVQTSMPNQPSVAALSARLPNGAVLELSCAVAADTGLFKALIETLWNQR
ncbi:MULTISPECIES: transposase [unclassified Pigmentiphaga]|uniref:IS66-like element accessory protein TnpA n=1 Tax=unclassified Pigmentiphaga TaxID=2626614 RepID=UPI000B411148|nr:MULTISPECIES: transposase [unclassified Pigmentiphaga]OVZ59174.1 hypothetical protein CDO44_13040 [Pigmentiphaga sp. NML080357]OVZ65297.1 hypothetical protein CDO46_07250 [Pigmentiphaga sp. NML030171]